MVFDYKRSKENISDNGLEIVNGILTHYLPITTYLEIRLTLHFIFKRPAGIQILPVSHW